MNVFRYVAIAAVMFILSVPAFSTETQDAEQKTARPPSFIETKQAIRKTLDSLVNAYVSKNARRFMSFIAEDFTGNDTLLDRRIRRDFSKFRDMDLRYTVNNLTTDSKNEDISVAVTFTRSYTDVKTARRINKKGSATFIFRVVNDQPKLYSMKGSSMFGVGK